MVGEIMCALMFIVVDDYVNHVFDNLPLIQISNLNRWRPVES